MDPVQSHAGTAVRPPAAALPNTAEAKRIKAVAQDVEAIFLRQLVSAMRSPVFGDASAASGSRQIYEDMVNDRLATAMSKGGGIGLADLIARDMLRRAATKISSSSAAGEPIGGDGGPNPAQGDHP